MNCGAMILPATSVATGGVCLPCKIARDGRPHPPADTEPQAMRRRSGRTLYEHINHIEAGLPERLETSVGLFELKAGQVVNGTNVLYRHAAYHGSLPDGTRVTLSIPDDASDHSPEWIAHLEHRLPFLRDHWPALLDQSRIRFRLFLWRRGYRTLDAKPIIAGLRPVRFDVGIAVDDAIVFEPGAPFDPHGWTFTISKTDKISGIECDSRTED